MAILLPRGNGSIQSITWTEFAHDVARLAYTLGELGVSPGDRVIHVSANRYEWLVTDLALHAIRAVHVPVHGTHSGEQIAAQFEHSGAMLAVVGETSLLEKFAHLVERPFPAIAYDAEAEDTVGQAKMIAFAAKIESASVGEGSSACRQRSAPRHPTIWRRFCIRRARLASLRESC